jgi:hypothetical protein
MGVPQSVFLKFLLGLYTLQPKSANLTTPPAAMRIFSGFISLWMIEY